MDFIIKETGERVEVYYRDSHGIDRAGDVTRNNVLREDDSVEFDEEENAYIAPRDVVEFWQKYFETATENDEELRALKNVYSSDEVDKIYLGLCDSYPDPDDVKSALAATRKTLEKRYNIETARLIDEYSSNLPHSDFRYFKETLYRQDTGEFFIAGEGGAMSGYGTEMSNGSMGYGERSFSLTRDEAEKWAVKRLGREMSSLISELPE